MPVREQTKRLGVQISCSVRLVLLACVVLLVKSAADLNQQPDYHLKKSSGSDVPGGTWRTGLYRPSTPRLARDHAAVYQKRNWCPHTVSKTVTCQVQNGTVLQRVYQSCVWPQGCSGASYKTLVRPSYRLVYRTVTSLEWRCCPGFSGAACEEELLKCLFLSSAVALSMLWCSSSVDVVLTLAPYREKLPQIKVVLRGSDRSPFTTSLSHTLAGVQAHQRYVCSTHNPHPHLQPPPPRITDTSNLSHPGVAGG
ncbi:unnamed protein product [Arctogadus glacialis]